MASSSWLLLLHGFFPLFHKQTKVIWGCVDFIRCDWQSVRLALHIAPGQTYVPPTSPALTPLTIERLTPCSEFQLLLQNTPDRFDLISHQDMIRRRQISCFSEIKKVPCRTCCAICTQILSGSYVASSLHLSSSRLRSNISSLHDSARWLRRCCLMRLASEWTSILASGSRSKEGGRAVFYSRHRHDCHCIQSQAE